MAVNVFLEFKEPTIKGECTDSNHKDDVELLAWSHSFSQPTSGTRSSAGGGTVEMATHGDMSCTKYIDSSSDDLIKMCWSGKHIGKATMHCYRSDGDNKPVKYLEIEMEDVIHYKIPFGPIGVLANYLFVQKKLGSIFVYRRKKLIELFGDLK